ncbi:MAG TPA: ABC transporter permease, partial [Bryobacteraceae bacterium]|nr:ABC transporter permease [Bryobacteraceae bacterium]
DPGFNVDHTMVVQYDTPSKSGMPPSELLRQLAARPDVRASAAAFRAPLVGHMTEPTHNMPWNQITEGYFATLGISLVRGRGFTAPEVSGNAQVVVISEGAARTLFPGAGPGGQGLTNRSAADRCRSSARHAECKPQTG